MKTRRNIIEIDEDLCDGCGLCIPSCAEGAIEMADGKAKVVAEKYCDGLGACIGECPSGALRIVERVADEFDEEAVKDFTITKKEKTPPELITLSCGCPSTLIQTFDPPYECRSANESLSQTDSESALSHWPVQIRLIPGSAPFLKNADLLITADCVPVAYPDFHGNFLRGKTVMLGCPKFDDAEAYVEKFTEIFQKSGIRSVTILSMEVPCCSGLPRLVRLGMEAAGRQIPVRECVISSRGKILRSAFYPAALKEN